MANEKEQNQQQDEEIETTVSNEESKENTQEETKESAPEKTAEEKLKEEIQESNEKYLRLMAEYDNFRKRTAKERLEITSNATANAVEDILPVLDNFERALETETTDAVYKQGIDMIFKQFNDAMSKLGVEVINPVGEVFDPHIANAVNQIEDPELGENVVAEVFQKGYKMGDKVIRYAMVVVANP